MTITGATLGHYRIVEQIGAGGMGVVYRAWVPWLLPFAIITPLTSRFAS